MPLLLVLLACDRPAPGYAFAGAELSFSATELSFGELLVDSTPSIPLDVTNTGTDATTLTLVVDAPFALSVTSLTVGPGETGTVSVRYSATGYTPAAGQLRVEWNEGSVEIPVSASTNPDSDGDGQEAVEVGGPDCDDRAAEVYAGAPDTCYDRVDQDCDATAEDPDDVDCDGDGFAVDVDDCDDGDATVYPGAAEVSADGVDQDCDGWRDEDDRAYGDLVISELHDGGENPGWLELCNPTAGVLPIDGFAIAWTTGSVVLEPYDLDAGACVAVCDRASTDCALVAELTFDLAEDQVAISVATLVLDAVDIPASWGWSAADTWSLDADRVGADLNDVASAWCDTYGSPGTMNPACP